MPRPTDLRSLFEPIIELQDHSDDKIYTNGDTLTGVAAITLHDVMLVREISVVYVVSANTATLESEELHTESEVVYKSATKVSSGEKKLHAETAYTYEFEIKIPDQNLPPSFGNKFGNIQHALEILIEPEPYDSPRGTTLFKYVPKRETGIELTTQQVTAQGELALNKTIAILHKKSKVVLDLTVPETILVGKQFELGAVFTAQGPEGEGPQDLAVRHFTVVLKAVTVKSADGYPETTKYHQWSLLDKEYPEGKPSKELSLSEVLDAGQVPVSFATRLLKLEYVLEISALVINPYHSLHKETLSTQAKVRVV